MANFVRLPSGAAINLDAVVSMHDVFMPGIRVIGRDGDLLEQGIRMLSAADDETIEDPADCIALRAWMASLAPIVPEPTTKPSRVDDVSFAVGDEVAFRYCPTSAEETGTITMIDDGDLRITLSDADATNLWMYASEIERVRKLPARDARVRS